MLLLLLSSVALFTSPPSPALCSLPSKQTPPSGPVPPPIPGLSPPCGQAGPGNWESEGHASVRRTRACIHMCAHAQGHNPARAFPKTAGGAKVLAVKGSRPREASRSRRRRAGEPSEAPALPKKPAANPHRWPGREGAHGTGTVTAVSFPKSTHTPPTPPNLAFRARGNFTREAAAAKLPRFYFPIRAAIGGSD